MGIGSCVRFGQHYELEKSITGELVRFDCCFYLDKKCIYDGYPIDCEVLERENER